MFDFTQNVSSRLRRTRLIDDWFRLDRFLTVGTEGATFDIPERPLTQENARAITACLAEDGERVVRRVVQISLSGRAPRNDAALFVLALAAGSDDDATRAAAVDAAAKVACLEVCGDLRNGARQ
jgi:60 kDa SS-A/Ro ribonucleoprotein